MTQARTMMQAEEADPFQVVFVGEPDSGKTTIFRYLNGNRDYSLPRGGFACIKVKYRQTPLAILDADIDPTDLSSHVWLLLKKTNVVVFFFNASQPHFPFSKDQLKRIEGALNELRDDVDRKISARDYVDNAYSESEKNIAIRQSYNHEPLQIHFVGTYIGKLKIENANCIAEAKSIAAKYQATCHILELEESNEVVTKKSNVNKMLDAVVTQLQCAFDVFKEQEFIHFKLNKHGIGARERERIERNLTVLNVLLDDANRSPSAFLHAADKLLVLSKIAYSQDLTKQRMSMFSELLEKFSQAVSQHHVLVKALPSKKNRHEAEELALPFMNTCNQLLAISNEAIGKTNWGRIFIAAVVCVASIGLIVGGIILACMTVGSSLPISGLAVLLGSKLIADIVLYGAAGAGMIVGASGVVISGYFANSAKKQGLAKSIEVLAEKGKNEINKEINAARLP